MEARFEYKLIALYVALAWAGMPLAHAADDETTEADADKPKLQTVTVNGERDKGFKTKYVQVGAFRDQSALDVPLTVNVIPQALLQAQDAQGLYDALKNSAGVSRAQTNGTVNDTLAIRGISVDARTNYRLNGSLPVINLIDLPLENKERVEALKGSSALYYGFSSPAGIINLVTKRAGNSPVSSIGFSFNEFGQAVGSVDVGRKFGENKQFGVRVNAAGGTLRNATDGFTGDRKFGSIALDWRVNDDLTLRFDYENIRKKAVENAGVVPLPAKNGVITLPAIPDSTKLLSGPWAVTDANAQNRVVRADYALGDAWAITLEAGQANTTRSARNFSQLQGYDVVTGEGVLRTFLTRGQQYENKNARAELTGRVDGFLDHELTFGVMKNERYQNGGGNQTIDIPGGQNLYNPRPIPAPVLTQALSVNPQQIEDKGIYFFDRVRLSPEWQVLLGARNSDYSNVTATSNYQVKKTSPSAGFIYKIRKDTSIYATYIEGVEETGMAPGTTVNKFTVMPPAVSKTKELGVRTESFAGMNLSAAFFTIDRAQAYINSANTYVVDGRIEYQGLEFAANGELTKNLQMYVTGMFLDARQKAGTASLVGKAPENTPKRTGSAFLEYQLPFVTGLSINGGAFYTSKRAVNAANQAFIPGVTIFTGGVRYATKMGGLVTSFQLNIENLSDKTYWAATGGNLLAGGMPRTIKGNVKIDF